MADNNTYYEYKCEYGALYCVKYVRNGSAGRLTKPLKHIKLTMDKFKTQRTKQHLNKSYSVD